MREEETFGWIGRSASWSPLSPGHSHSLTPSATPVVSVPIPSSTRGNGGRCVGRPDKAIYSQPHTVGWYVQYSVYYTTALRHRNRFLLALSLGRSLDDRFCCLSSEPRKRRIFAAQLSTEFDLWMGLQAVESYSESQALSDAMGLKTAQFLHIWNCSRPIRKWQLSIRLFSLHNGCSVNSWKWASSASASASWQRRSAHLPGPVPAIVVMEDGTLFENGFFLIVFRMDTRF
jgi:hypothetical protein